MRRRSNTRGAVMLPATATTAAQPECARRPNAARIAPIISFIRYRGYMTPAQWSRTAFAIALVFGSFPVAGRIFLGDWEFEAAAGIACLCAVAGIYFRVLDRRAFRAIPDLAAMLDQ